MTEMRKELIGEISYRQHELRDIDREIALLMQESRKLSKELRDKQKALRWLTCDDETVLADYAEYMRIDVQIDDPELSAKFTEHLKQKHRHEIRRERKIADNERHLRKLREKRVNRMEIFVEMEGA